MQTQMPAMSASSALNLLHLLLLAATSKATTINITNRCSYTVWPAALTVEAGTGRELKTGQVWTLNMPSGASSARIWARTGCSFGSNGKGSCQTGDCGGALACSISSQPPNTLAKFTTGRTQDFFDISVINGFNVPMEFLPVRVQGEKECSKEIKVTGGCNNTCTGTGYINCTYSGFFKRMCPDAYILANDSATHACPAGTNYQVTFCPLINLAISHAAMSPPPTPVLEIAPSPLIAPKMMRSGVDMSALATLAFIAITPLVSVFSIIFYICKRRPR